MRQRPREPLPPTRDLGVAPDWIEFGALGEWGCQAGLAALVAATPVIPTETAHLGLGGIVLLGGWFALAVAWLLVAAWTGKPALRWDATSGCVVALIGWLGLSALIMGPQGQARATWHVWWTWASLGVAFLLIRRMGTAAKLRRAMVVLMLAQATSLAVLGLYQHFIELPAVQAEYARDPEGVTARAGITAAPGTPQYKLFADRLNSVEPLATFALTNTFAAYLALWLLTALGVWLVAWATPLAEQQSRLPRASGIALGCVSLVLATCLVLTKSRTAWLATAGSVALLGIFARPTGWRPGWRVISGVLLTATALPVLAGLVGGLDWLVLLESSKSFLYRTQYWRSTAALIADHPWFGCGPGNFQQYYLAYKLPEASESIAEPHNLVLEIGAAGGVPAMLLWGGVLASIVLLAARRRTTHGSTNEPESGKISLLKTPPGRPLTAAGSRATDRTDLGSLTALFGGGIAGCLGGACLCGLLEGFFPSGAWFLLGLPAGIAVAWALFPWLERGHLTVSVLAIALIALGVTFLASGGISFAGVAVSGWLATALLLAEIDEARGRSAHEVPRVNRRAAWLLVLAASGLFVAFVRTELSPSMAAAGHLMAARRFSELGQVNAAREALLAAAQADPLSPDPWDSLAEVSLAAWRESADLQWRDEFARATRELLARHSQSSPMYSMAGHRWLAAYRRFGERDHLAEAIRCYRVALERYPNYNQGHAQLAWALRLAGDPAAREAAAEALRLDALTPHAEQKLSEQRLYDVPPTVAGQPAAAGERTAEQWMQELRSSQT